MYAKRLSPIPESARKSFKPLLTLGEHMKKIGLALLLLFVGYSAHADTPTSTATPTSTITPTFTPTPTRTNTPVSGFGSQTGRVIVQAQEFLSSDGVTIPVTTPVVGVGAWLAQTLSYTAYVFSTGTASARIQFTVPADYMRTTGFWLYGYNSSVTNTVTLQADVSKVSFGALTSTSRVYVGTATNVQTQNTGRMFDARYNRIWIPLNVALYGGGSTGGTALKAGDLLNILIQRTGASGNLAVFAAEFEYAVNYPLRP